MPPGPWRMCLRDRLLGCDAVHANHSPSPVTRSCPTRRVWSVTENSAPAPMLMDGSCAARCRSSRSASTRASSAVLSAAPASESSTTTASDGSLLAFFLRPGLPEAAAAAMAGSVGEERGLGGGPGSARRGREASLGLASEPCCVPQHPHGRAATVAFFRRRPPAAKTHGAAPRPQARPATASRGPGARQPCPLSTRSRRLVRPRHSGRWEGTRWALGLAFLRTSHCLCRARARSRCAQRVVSVARAPVGWQRGRLWYTQQPLPTCPARVALSAFRRA